MIKFKQSMLKVHLIILLLGSSIFLTAQTPCGFQIEVGEDVIIDLGQSVELLGQISIPLEQVDSFLWSPSVGLSCDDCPATICTPTENICYEFSVTDTSSCTVTDTICVFINQSNHSNDLKFKHSILLYPNPTSDLLFLDLESNSIQDIMIYNISGQLLKMDIVASKDQKIIDVSQLSNGLYFIKIKINNHFEIRKFIKNSN